MLLLHILFVVNKILFKQTSYIIFYFMDILARAVGRRKEAVAQVQIKRGTGQFIINNKPAQEYLQNDFYSLLSVKAPFHLLSNTNQSNGLIDQNLSLNSNFSTELKNQDTASDFASDSAEQNHTLHVESALQTQDSATQNQENPMLVNLDTIITVKGGGIKGQTEAIRLGISRALCLVASTPNSFLDNSTVLFNEIPLNLSNLAEIRKQLKDKGYLTQDSRVKERRKYGLKKARKASQYHKR